MPGGDEVVDGPAAAASTTSTSSPSTRRTLPIVLRSQWPRSSARTARTVSAAGAAGIEQPRRAVVPHEHAVLAGRLRLGRQVAGREGGGDAREARQRRLVAPGVQRERGLVVADREVLDGDDLAAVDVGRHQVPRDGVLALAAEDRPGRHVQPGVARERAVVEVDRRRHLGEHVVGDQAQVGDAEQHVGRVLGEPGGELGAGTDDGDAVLDGPAAHELVRRRDEDDLEPVGHGDLAALLDEWLVTDERAAHARSRSGWTTTMSGSRCAAPSHPHDTTGVTDDTVAAVSSVAAS